MHFRDVLRLPLFLSLCIALILPGCAGMGGGEQDDPSDVCRPQRAALRSTGENFTQDILAGAAVGAVTGGIIGGLASGNLRGAAIGALAGGLVGAAAGYLNAKQKQYSDQAQLYQSVYGDVQRENLNIDKTQIAFNQLIDCRNGEASRIRADYRAGRMSRDLATNLMAGVRAHAASDLRLAREISGHIRSRSADFADVDRQLQAPYSGDTSGQRTAVRRTPVTNRAAAQVQTATSTNVAKRDQFEQTITRAQSNQTQFELS